MHDEESDDENSEEESSIHTSLTSDPLSPSVVEQITDDKIKALREEIITIES